MTLPVRGEVWYAGLDPVRGHEQGGTRPVVVISATPFNRSRAELVLVLPITSRQRSIPSHVAIQPPEGGLSRPGDILCDAIRSISRGRLDRRVGAITASTLAAVEDRLRLLLEL